MSHLDADALSALHHIEPHSQLAASLTTSTIQSFAKVQRPQTSHRIDVLKAWDLQLEGKSVLEIGCGQGDASVVLTSAVGKGRVIAWDPASQDYGSPLTVGQAQANLKSKPQLSGLTFHLGCPLTDLLGVNYDMAVLLHCIYYFPSPDVLSETLRALHPRVETLCIAEYSLQASMQSQQPHVLAVLAQQALESQKPLGESESNVQTVLSPRAIIALAKACGWSLVRETSITPDVSLQDGRWEVGTVYSPEWLKEVEEVLGKARGETSRQRAWLAAAQDATTAAVDSLKAPDESLGKGGQMEKVRTMDVWCAVFKRDDEVGKDTA